MARSRYWWAGAEGRSWWPALTCSLWTFRKCWRPRALTPDSILKEVGLSWSNALDAAIEGFNIGH